MDLFSISAIILLLLLLYWTYKFAYAPFQVFKGTGIKGPTPVPFFGNYRERSRIGMLKYYEKLLSKYGSVVGLYLGQTPTILVADLDIVKQILVKEFEVFTNRPHFPDLLRKSKDGPHGLLTSRGETWKRARKTLSPTFSASKMKMMVPLIKRSTDTLVRNLEEEARSNNSFEVLRVFGSFTMETILATAFGRVIEVQKGESGQLMEAVGGIFSKVEEGKSTSLSALLVLLSNFPWLESVLHFLLYNTERGRHFLFLHDTATSLVKARRESGKSKHKDLLQLMIDATGDEEKEGEEDGGHKEDSSNKATAGRKLTDDEIVSHCLHFLLAAYETTANTLAFTSYLLALNPEIQEKLQREIDDYFEEKPDCSLYDAAKGLEYLDMVLQESLRMYPPGVVATHYTAQSITLNGITFPKGASIYIPIFHIHKDPLYWKDPEKFDPERFTAEEKAKRPQLAHMPFGFGPRNCIGMRFAHLEAKMALIELLKKYSFVRAPDTEVPLQVVVGGTLIPKHGIFLKVESRTGLK